MFAMRAFNDDWVVGYLEEWLSDAAGLWIMMAALIERSIATRVNLVAWMMTRSPTVSMLGMFAT